MKLCSVGIGSAHLYHWLALPRHITANTTEELKHDGFRALAYIENGQCRLVSRNLKSLRIESLQAALGKLPVKNTIIDGEIICLDEKGVSQFNWLLNGRHADRALLYAFDLLWLDGEDLRRLPLVVRKKRLNDLARSGDGCRILYAQPIEGAGKEFFNEICRCDLEGIVAKRKRGAYREDRPDWLKIKNRTYSQSEGRHELLARKTGRHR